MVFLGFQADAQTVTKQAAFSSETGEITLAEGDLQEYYKIPVGEIGLVTSRIYKWSRGSSNNLVEFRYDEGATELTLVLHLDRAKEEWTSIEWKSYLQEIAPRLKKSVVAYSAN